MATIELKYNPRTNVGATPWGNEHGLQYTLTTNSIGAAVGSNSAAALAIADKVILGRIPAGSVLNDALMIVSTTFTASVTGTLGFEYADGVDDADVPQDADYFAAAGMVLTTAARLRQSTAVAPVTLPKDANLVLVIAGAANAKVARLDVILHVASEGVL